MSGYLDLFGEGSVYILRAVGHTPESQKAAIGLPHTGAVIPASDAAPSLCSGPGTTGRWRAPL